MNAQFWTSIEDLTGFSQDARNWLTAHVSADMPWLLIHADDGVIWGRREPNGNLLLSSDVFDRRNRHPAIAVELRTMTIQQCRVFGRGGELLIWREGPQFRGRAIQDQDTKDVDLQDEQHLLWGNPVEERQGFSLLEEGQQGPKHAVPIVVPRNCRASLTVRHYIGRDDHGQAAVLVSRLLGLGLHEPRKES